MEEEVKLTEVKTEVETEVKVDESLDAKLRRELSLKDNKEDVRKVVENAIEIKAGGMTANDEELLNQLVKNKAEILKEQSKAEKIINKHRNERDTTEAITQKDKAFFERNKQLLEKANIKEPCAKSYMMLMLCIIIPIAFVTNLMSLMIKVPFEVINVFATGIDNLFVRIAGFSKSAKVIAVSLLVILLVTLVLYVIYNLLNRYNII